MDERAEDNVIFLPLFFLLYFSPSITLDLQMNFATIDQVCVIVAKPCIKS